MLDLIGPLNIPGFEADENLKNAPLADSFIFGNVVAPFDYETQIKSGIIQPCSP